MKPPSARALGEPGCHERQADRAGVGEHVGGVGEQGQRVGEDPDHHLDRHEAEDQAERGAEAGSGGVGAWWW